MKPISFTIRVYGLLINPNGEVLVSDEIYKNKRMTKFPGGGLEPGESTLTCLKREFKEELGLNIEVIQHFYTTDEYVISAFDPEVQLLSIYYLVDCKEEYKINSAPLDLLAKKAEHFYFKPIKSIAAEKDFSFPIDQIIAKMLVDNYKPTLQ